jgi:thymidylate synthase
LVDDDLRRGGGIHFIAGAHCYMSTISMVGQISLKKVQNKSLKKTILGRKVTKNNTLHLKISKNQLENEKSRVSWPKLDDFNMQAFNYKPTIKFAEGQRKKRKTAKEESTILIGRNFSSILIG